MKAITCLLMLIVAVPLLAVTLQPAGVLGNSGIAGSSLIRVTSEKPEDLVSGAYLDADQCLWLNAGNGINQVSLAGALLAQYPLDPAGSRCCSHNFAVADGKLFFFAFLPRRETKTYAQIALFALPLQGGKVAQVVMPLPETNSNIVGLAQEPVNGELVMAYTCTRDGKPTIAIEGINPMTMARRRLFTLPGESVSSLASDPDGHHLYLGGNFGRYVGGSVWHQYASDIVKLTLEGTELWRRVTIDPGPEPVYFTGNISYAAGALWDGAWYGFLGRLDRDGNMAPGMIGNWLMQTPRPTQVLDVRRALAATLLPPTAQVAGLDPLIIADRHPHQVYFATWDTTTRRLTLTRRYGSLPNIYSLNMNADGWVAVGMDDTTYWWHYDDAPWAPPAAANFEGNRITQGAFRGNELCVLLAFEKKGIPTVTRPANGRGSAARFFEYSPWGRARAFAIGPQAGQPDRKVAFVTATDGTLWHTPMQPGDWRPDTAQWAKLTIAAGTLAHAGDVAVLGDGRVAVADSNAVVILTVQGDTATVATRFTTWGAPPDAHFGDILHLAADGHRLLVADTARHRVLLFDTVAFQQPLSSFGVTDTPGDDQYHLSTPGPVSLCGNRAVVADVDNQRIMKLCIE